MGALGDLIGGLLKPLLVALLVIVALGLVSNGPGSAGSAGTGAGGAFSCPNWFDDPALNRTICKYHPARVWNTPVADLLPWLSAAADDVVETR